MTTNYFFRIWSEAVDWIKAYLRIKLKRHDQIRSLKDFSFPIDTIKVVYDYPFLNIKAEEYCETFKIRGAVVNLDTGFVFFQSQYHGDYLIEESSKDNNII